MWHFISERCCRTPSYGFFLLTGQIQQPVRKHYIGNSLPCFFFFSSCVHRSKLSPSTLFFFRSLNHKKGMGKPNIEIEHQVEKGKRAIWTITILKQEGERRICISLYWKYSKSAEKERQNMLFFFSATRPPTFRRVSFGSSVHGTLSRPYRISKHLLYTFSFSHRLFLFGRCFGEWTMCVSICWRFCDNRGALARGLSGWNVFQIIHFIICHRNEGKEDGQVERRCYHKYSFVEKFRSNSLLTQFFFFHADWQKNELLNDEIHSNNCNCSSFISHREATITHFLWLIRGDNHFDIFNIVSHNIMCGRRDNWHLVMQPHTNYSNDFLANIIQITLFWHFTGALRTQRHTQFCLSSPMSMWLFFFSILLL